MVDTGLLILIWMVQIIIYPSFAQMKPQGFLSWHVNYMRLITFIVAPLMFFQLAISGYQALSSPGVLNLLSVSIVIFLWLHTFLAAVPLHNVLSSDGNHSEIVRKLVRVNWLRTIGWSILWLISLQQLFSSAAVSPASL